MIVLACTELQLAIDINQIDDIPVIDTSYILARALVREADKKKLCKLQDRSEKG
ncbi:hypothetical protein EDD76_108130 [Kineothrix alysoides]|uniref:Asp/Glu/hydantoin racemase n=2 Tax=Kineothrix alysoides TaxID=1469948 RepID=A0A4R1QX15_9FIRM|nr:hypothetical protein [Kineothrix alysoides]TCL57595.1 hypothetical protein EDD76_108130 [Kineothrix alysoides]